MPDSPRWSGWRGGRARRDAMAVALVALVVRVVLVLVDHRPPPTTALRDPEVYWRFAIEIARGHGYVSLHGKPTAYYPPGYPYFLGSLQWICNQLFGGHHLPLVAGLTQALLGAIGVGATALAGQTLGRRLGDERLARRLGLGAGLILALWPNLVLYTAVFLSETLFVAIFAVFVLAALRLRSDDGTLAPGWAVTAAVSLGLSTLVRPQVLVVLIALAVAWAVGRRGLRVIVFDLALLILGVMVVLTPWVIRNEVVMHSFIALSDNSGDNLCVGFNPQADGAFEIPPYCNTDQLYVAGPAAELQRDAHTKHLAVEWATHHVGALPTLSARKLRYTYDTDTDGLRALEAYEADRFLSSGVRTTLHWVSDGAYIAIMALAAGGAVWMVVRGVKARRGQADGTDGVAGTVGAVLAMTVLSAAIPIAFFGDGRFKVPTTPLFALCAGAAMAAAWTRGRGQPGAGGAVVVEVVDSELRPIVTS
jgi:4-amino-4-deoxy-L-arabinose transferase-like glycosyltransferase